VGKDGTDDPSQQAAPGARMQKETFSCNTFLFLLDAFKNTKNSNTRFFSMKAQAIRVTNYSSSFLIDVNNLRLLR
jgi:hypothetical protein